MKPRTSPPRLRCGLLPGEASPVMRRMHEALRAYLEHQLGMPVELVIPATYAATGEALREGRLDIAYLGPVSYILQSRHAALEPFARPTHGGHVGPTFRAAIVVPGNSAVQTLHQLRGREIAFGDLASTSGSWVPRHQLLSAGLQADQDYRRRQLGAHDAVARAVAQHQCAAGGLSLPVLQRLTEEGLYAPGALRILAVSRPIPEYMWTFRAGLPTHLKEDLRAAFIRLPSPEALHPYRATAFIPAVDADVDRVRLWMEDLLQARPQPALAHLGALEDPGSDRPINPAHPTASPTPAGPRPAFVSGVH